MMLAAAVCLSCLCVAAESLALDVADWPVQLGNEPQLLLDESLVARHEHVVWSLHQPTRHVANPLIEPTRTYERLVLAYGSVLRCPDTGRFRFWYTNDTGIAYAESKDGVRWSKPPVGLEINGRVTNVLTRGHRGRSDTLSVLLNPDAADPERRFLAYVFEYRFPDRDGVRESRREGLYLRTSPDGIHWQERPQPVMYSMWRDARERTPGTSGDLGDVHHISWDAKLGKFIGHVKLAVEGLRKRGLTESDDGIHWDTPHLMMEADSRDRPGDQTYSMVAFPYGNVWLAYVGMYHKETDDRLDIQLAVSHDGRNWQRPYREPYLANGPEGAFDWGVLHMAANPPLLVDDKLFIYYGGYGTAHNVKLRDVRKFGIGLATLRPDGFVSVDAGPQTGSFVTRPCCYRGNRLYVNADVEPGSSLRVAVLDSDYKPLVGCSLEECRPVSGDSLRAAVVWNAKTTLPATNADRHVRFKFQLQNASFYSFTIE